jgi:hypothetical protein
MTGHKSSDKSGAVQGIGIMQLSSASKSVKLICGLTNRRIFRFLSRAIYRCEKGSFEGQLATAQAPAADTGAAFERSTTSLPAGWMVAAHPGHFVISIGAGRG